MKNLQLDLNKTGLSNTSVTKKRSMPVSRIEISKKGQISKTYALAMSSLVLAAIAIQKNKDKTKTSENIESKSRSDKDLKPLQILNDSDSCVMKLTPQSWQKIIPEIPNKVADKKNYLGSGAEAYVFALDEDYVLRIPIPLFTDKRIFDGKNLKYKPIKDIFEGRNFGQPVAYESSFGSALCKRVPGAYLYDNDEVIDLKIYMKTLRECANLPDETLENYVSDVAFINSKGYRIDHGSAGNFLFDKETGKIGIIDISRIGDHLDDKFVSFNHSWVVSPLFNGVRFQEIYENLSVEDRKEALELIGQIEKRILPLCEKYNIPRGKWDPSPSEFNSVINILDLREEIDVSKCDDVWQYIIYKRYPSLIEGYERWRANKDKI